MTKAKCTAQRSEYVTRCFIHLNFSFCQDVFAQQTARLLIAALVKQQWHLNGSALAWTKTYRLLLKATSVC